MMLNPVSALILSIGMLGSVGMTLGYLSPADAQSSPAASGGGDVLLTMPVLADKGWFVQAYNGRVRACTADGASVSGERPAPRCSNWSD
jgi:hypothetical protein